MLIGAWNGCWVNQLTVSITKHLQTFQKQAYELTLPKEYWLLLLLFDEIYAYVKNVWIHIYQNGNDGHF